MAIVSYVRCVKCGGKIKVDLENFRKRQPLPPCCEKHCDEIIEEISHKISMWPSGWFGHSMRKFWSGIYYWTVDIEECEESDETFVN